MATVTLQYDGRNTSIRKLIEVIVALGAKKTVIKERKNSLDIALEDVRAGRVHTAESVEDMMKQILG
ncbi:MAG: hypothetical protein IKQ75_10055 [Bacteroidales bacterium]|nr:hypothetical protein [Bacteroidales bacterium]MBR6162189.1 hypothetical protein [Bacteroidales bacterium]MCR4858526.1 hypothetical protein [Bacteroidales bacterium]